MQNLKQKTWIATLLAAICAVSLFACGWLWCPQRAAAEEWKGESPAAEYVYGTHLNIPSRTLRVGDEEAEAVSVLTYPDGTATLERSVVLDMTGIYTLNYTAEIGGKVYKTGAEFEVYDRIFRTGERSSAVYGKHDSAAEKQGLIVSLAQGETLEFTPIIDVSSASAQDTLFEFFVTPDAAGTLDFGRLVFTLTDAEDPSVTLTISARASVDGPQYPYTYFLAGGNSQPLEGWEPNLGILHINNDYGTPVEHSFYCNYPAAPGAAPDAYPVAVCYDAAERTVYADGMFVVDLDSSEYFSYLWNGFPSGRVRLSVYADEYAGTAAKFVISALAGVDLSAGRLADTAAPVITVDTPYDRPPEACVGLPYPVPAATAVDDYSGRCEVAVQVWYNYASGTPFTMPVQDGEFLADRAGLYAIVYRASDRQGNVSEKILWVKASELPAPRLVLDVENRVTQAYAGEYVPVSACTAEGGSGEVRIRCYAVLGGERTEIEGGGFRPQSAGKYTVLYEAADHLGRTAAAAYSLTVENGLEPVFTEQPQLPRYFISGSSYALSPLYAADYSSGSYEPVEATLTVTDAQGERTISSGEAFTPVAAENGDIITLVYSARGTQLPAIEIPAVIPFENDGTRPRLQMENYLVSADASYVKKDSAIEVTAGSSQASWMFANKLLAEGFTLELRALPEKSAFAGIRFELTDSADASVSVLFEIRNENGRAYLSAGESRIQLASGFSASSASTAFALSYASGSVSAGDATLPLLAAGQAFGGFPSGYAYLTVSFVGAQAGAAYEITDINGQPMSNAVSDRIRPKIVLFGEYGDAVVPGETVTVPAALAGDVLDPNVTFTLTVTAPDGSPVTSADGVRLTGADPSRSYVFTAEMFGQYQVTYTAADSFSGREQTLGFAVTAEDRLAPAVTFTQDAVQSVRAGEIIVLPEFTVTDDVSAAEEISVRRYMVTGEGRIIELADGVNAFRPLYAGRYQYRVVAVDASGNIAIARADITVTAE